jgi:hypothetical protein
MITALLLPLSWKAGLIQHHSRGYDYFALNGIGFGKSRKDMESVPDRESRAARRRLEKEDNRNHSKLTDSYQSSRELFELIVESLNAIQSNRLDEVKDVMRRGNLIKYGLLVNQPGSEETPCPLLVVKKPLALSTLLYKRVILI